MIYRFIIFYCSMTNDCHTRTYTPLASIDEMPKRYANLGNVGKRIMPQWAGREAKELEDVSR